MTWTLQIWHIDVTKSGDSTLIIARDDGKGAGHKKQTRTALIDGGHYGTAHEIHNLLVHENVDCLNVMVATHYDEDHINGLRALLEGTSPIYENTHVYDQGEPGKVTLTLKRTAEGASVFKPEYAQRDDDYIRYVRAIAKRLTRTHETGKVLSNEEPTGNLKDDEWQGPDWLVGKEVLWHSTGKAPPTGAPTLRCIAANQYVLQPNGEDRILLTAGALAHDPKNEKSLAFLLTFGNFRYYLGGDIEATQEDGSRWSGAKYALIDQKDRNASLMMYLNRGNNLAGQVHAFKTSHHGSKYSSSPEFMKRLRARAAFISCGTDNQHGHPDQVVVNNLEKDPTVEWYFLTGEDMRSGSTRVGLFGEVAGVWIPETADRICDGDILLEVTAAESVMATVNFRVGYFQSDAGTNYDKDLKFPYKPYKYYTTTFF